jgi:putative PEP-CTERM system TPR-repeat lipoprotein
MNFVKYKKTTISLLCMSSLLVLTSCGESKSPSEYMQDAQNSLVANDFNSAIISLKNMVRLEPQNVKTRLALGELYLKIGDDLSAEKEILKAEELGADLNLIAPLLLEVSLLQTNYNEAIVYAESIKSELNKTSGDKVKFLHLAALSYQGSLKDNLFEIERLQKSENALYATFGDFFELTLNEDYQAALTLFETINQEKLPLESFIIAGRLYTFEGLHSKASAVYQQYINTRVKDYKAKILIAESLIEEQRFDEAEVFVEQVLLVSKNQAFANQLKAIIYFNKEDFVQAQEFASNSINNGLASGINKLILAISNFQLDNLEQSHSYFNEIIDLIPPEHPLRNIYIMVELKLGYINEVTAKLMSDEDINELDANLLVAASYELIKSSKQKTAKGLISKLEGTEFDPSSRGKLGFMKLAVGDESASSDLLAGIKNQPGNEQLKVALALSYFQNKKIEQAIEVALDWIESNPELASGYNLAGYFYTQTKNLDKAKEVYQQALEFIPNNQPSLLFESYERERVGDINGAEQITLRLIDAHPDFITAYSRLYQIYNLQNKGDRIYAFLEDANQKKSNPKLILLMADMYLEARKFKKVVELLSDTAMEADNKIIKIKILSRAYEGLSDIEKSISTYEELLELNTNNNVSLKLLALYEKNKSFNKALQIIDKGLISSPNESHLLYLKALFETYSGNMKGAQTALDTLRENQPEDIYLRNIQGLIYLESKLFEKAKKELLPIYLEKPSNKTAMNIYIANKNLGDSQSNIKFLTQHIEQYPDAQSIRILLAQLLADTNPDATIEHYNYILKTQPGNWPILNNIAWSYAQIGDLNLAEENIRKAMLLNGNNLNLLDTLTYILKQKNKPNELVSEIELIDLNALSSSDIKLRYAWALIQIDRKNDARVIIGRLGNLSQKQKELKAQLRAQL